MRISETARRMVVFFGGPSPKDGKTILGGTGFLVLHREEGEAFSYLVTAKHVAAKIRPNADVVVRANEKGGDYADFTIDEIYWAHHPDETVDVAVTQCGIDPSKFDVAYYNLADLVQPDSTSFRVQCGDPISIIGLFHYHSGAARIVPIVHSGNIALLPDPNEKILITDRATGNPVSMEAYLVEAQTFEGLSGAPVFQREWVENAECPIARNP